MEGKQRKVLRKSDGKRKNISFQMQSRRETHSVASMGKANAFCLQNVECASENCNRACVSFVSLSSCLRKKWSGSALSGIAY
jgi:hypothetical protein